MKTEASSSLSKLNEEFGYHQLEKLVAGALKSAIDAHGPISKDNLSSASKRIARQVWGSFKDSLEKVCKE